MKIDWEMIFIISFFIGLVVKAMLVDGGCIVY